MGFKICCPNCGEREVYEFSFGGEDKTPPGPDADLKDWREHLYLKKNRSGTHQEWWIHAGGCGAWFKITRDTETNRIITE